MVMSPARKTFCTLFSRRVDNIVGACWGAKDDARKRKGSDDDDVVIEEESNATMTPDPCLECCATLAR